MSPMGTSAAIAIRPPVAAAASPPRILAMVPAKDEAASLPEILSAEGYRTAASISAYVVSEIYHLDQGFQDFLGGEAYRDIDATSQLTERPSRVVHQPSSGRGARLEHQAHVHATGGRTSRVQDPHAQHALDLVRALARRFGHRRHGLAAGRSAATRVLFLVALELGWRLELDRACALLRGRARGRARRRTTRSLLLPVDQEVDRHGRQHGP